MKKLICLMIVVIMMLGCVASIAVAEDTQKHIVFVTPLIAHEVWLVAKEGFDDACAAYGIRGDWVGPSVIDVEEMIRQIETAIVENVDGIITQGMNPQAMVPVLTKANEAGIPVVVVNSDIPDAVRLGYLGTEPVNFGKTGAKHILSVMGDKEINAAFMISQLDYNIGIDMINGYERELANATGGYKKVSTAVDKSDMMEAVTQWQNIFTTYPECNVAICVEASATAAAAKVVEEMKLDVFIMGIDDTAEALDYIGKGIVDATMTQNFYRMGYEPVTWILDYLDNGEKPELLNDSGTTCVTKENLATYAEDMKAPETW